MSMVELRLHPMLLRPLGLVSLQKLRDRQGIGFDDLLPAYRAGELGCYWIETGPGKYVVAFRECDIVRWRFRHGHFIEPRQKH